MSEQSESKKHFTAAELFKAFQQDGSEKLKELLGQMDHCEEIVVGSDVLASMSDIEKNELFHQLLKSRRTFIWDGLRHVYDWNPGPVCISYSELPEKLRARLRK
ncbi:hypothetical protein [Occallatibacter riparius]|uniref:Uncharacterized protein n=1 Tax=Occallatibacter riparius TaxID=1002689 RepID=A0A9J7BLS5_9BACT|nr:hypothetical protein [Occallatibacter riparius]UWZ83836.1 hypothetical protein MOP44_25155 [Occallatibacter riparius]